MKLSTFFGIAIVITGLFDGAAALAHRPTDGTDGAVLDPGQFELELQPASFVRDGAERTAVAPKASLNLGIAEGWEATLEGDGQRALRPAGGGWRSTGNGAFLKHVLRDGVLQGQAGPSLATEFGMLLPGTAGEEHGIGAVAAGILSSQLGAFPIHLNLQTALTRRQHADIFGSASSRDRTNGTSVRSSSHPMNGKAMAPRPSPA